MANFVLPRPPKKDACTCRDEAKRLLDDGLDPRPRKPALGARPITAIEAPEILQVLRGVEARDRPETARRLRSVIGSVRFAVATGGASNDPPAALRITVRPRATIIDRAGLGELLRAIDRHSSMPEVRGEAAHQNEMMSPVVTE